MRQCNSHLFRVTFQRNAFLHRGITQHIGRYASHLQAAVMPPSCLMRSQSLVAPIPRRRLYVPRAPSHAALANTSGCCQTISPCPQAVLAVNLKHCTKPSMSSATLALTVCFAAATSAADRPAGSVGGWPAGLAPNACVAGYCIANSRWFTSSSTSSSYTCEKCVCKG